MKTRLLPLTAVLALVLAASAPAPGQAPAYTNPQLHYTLKLPDDWVRIPDDAMQEQHKAAVERIGARAPEYDAGFQRKADSWFLPPYALLQHHAVNDATLASLENTFLRNDLTPFTGDLTKAGIAVSPGGAAESYADDKRKMIFFTIRLAVSGGPPIKCLTAMVPGKAGLVQLNFYAPETDYAREKPAFDRVLDGFAFDRGFEYSALRATVRQATSPRALNDTLIAGISGAVVAAVAGLFIAWMRNRKNPKPPAASG